MLAWRHTIGPGFVILIAAACLFVAFILQILVSVGLPDLRSIYFLTFTLSDLGQEIKIGLWTLCTNQFYSSFWMQDDGETCQGNSLGYHDSQYGDIAQQILIPGLTKALAIQPLSTALTGVAVVAAGLHLCTNFIFWPFLCALAAVCSIACFVIEIVLFSTARMRLNSNRMVEWFGSPISQSSFGAGIWIQLAAMALVIFATSLDWTAFVRRRLHKTHSAGRLGKKAPSIYRASVAGSERGDDEKAARGLPYDMARSHSRASSGTTATAKGSVGGDSAGKGSNRSKIAAGAATAAAASPRNTQPAPALKTYNKSRKSVPSMEMESLPSPGATGAAAAASSSPETARRRQQHGRVDSDIVVDSDVVAAARTRRTSQPHRARTPSRSSTARSEEFVDAPAAEEDDESEDEERGEAVGARYAKYNAPMDPKDDTVISPRKGSRQARYSARMAELDA